ncbi:MarR family winged helix-turn-helix transcriptional regulator [Amycolatopsis jejuensis]|uniref:MarR family winged helix-turn-helix transcriptional regulator n=1 Tax=Amycolatopsis jejuensis TaxID=330084 RepID=UPI000526BA92|nr:MarR family transcriptional regulator [Amycolatopsis jejuensis]
MAPNSSTVRPQAELDLADRLSYELVRFMRLLTKVKAQVAKQGPDGIERAAYAILFCLVHEGPQRTSKLAEFLHSEISTISRQSSSLVQHGLVERQADPEDGRACLLAPTAEGLRVFDENRKQRARWMADVLSDWSPEDRETLNHLLARLNTGIETNNPSLSDTGGVSQAKGASNA